MLATSPGQCWRPQLKLVNKFGNLNSITPQCFWTLPNLQNPSVDLKTLQYSRRYTTLRKQNIMHPFSNRSCLLSTVREQQGFNRGIVSAILNPVARSYHTASYQGNTARSYHSYHGNCDVKAAGGGLMRSLEYSRSAFKQLKRFVK